MTEKQLEKDDDDFFEDYFKAMGKSFDNVMGDFMTNKRDYSLCIDCVYQDGTWVSDREVDTWCTIKKGVDCDKVFECDDFKGDVE